MTHLFCLLLLRLRPKIRTKKNNQLYPIKLYLCLFYVNFKIIFITKTILCSLAIGLFAITGCMSKKTTVQKAEDLTEIKEPFEGNDFRTSDDFFRAVGSDKSQDASFSKTKSEADARAKLTSAIKTNVESLYKKYVNEYSSGNTQEYNDKAQNEINNYTNMNIVETRVVGQKLFKNKDGYVSYTAIEVSKDVIYNGVKKRISDDQKLHTDFKEAQFDKVIQEERKKFAEENK